MLAPCGLDCSVCDIHLAPERPDIAEKLTNWFREHVSADACPEWFHCAGCPGNRVDHWSADCTILRCCADDHGLRYCSECADFVCEELATWASRAPKYQAALERLKGKRG